MTPIIPVAAVRIVTYLDPEQVEALQHELSPRHVVERAATVHGVVQLLAQRRADCPVVNPAAMTNEGLESIVNAASDRGTALIIWALPLTRVAKLIVQTSLQIRTEAILHDGYAASQWLELILASEEMASVPGLLLNRLAGRLNRLPPETMTACVRSRCAAGGDGPTSVDTFVRWTRWTRKIVERHLHRAQLGTINEFLHACRLARSFTMLQRPTAMSADVARRVGYSSVESLNKHFKEYLGVGRRNRGRWFGFAAAAEVLAVRLGSDDAGLIGGGDRDSSSWPLMSKGFGNTQQQRDDFRRGGLTNDRAFIFNPATTDDQQLGTGMRLLLPRTTRSVRHCLEAQLGRVVGENTCLSGWSMNVGTIAISLDPYRIHLGNRGNLTVYLTNLLQGIDRALHGSSGLRRWGELAYPDSRLLTVRGFDSVSKRFRYAVNGSFGQATSLVQQPLGLTLDLHFSIGPDAETEAMNQLVRAPAGTPWTVETLTHHLMPLAGPHTAEVLLAIADSLRLTARQQTALRRCEARLQTFRDSTMRTLAAFLLDHQERDDGATRARWHGAFAAILRAAVASATDIRAELTPPQLFWIRTRMGAAAGIDYSPDWVERRIRGPLP